MTVSVETNKSQLLVYASGTDQYSWGTFEVPTEDDLRAYVFDDSGNGDATLLTLTTHYTVDTVNKRIELTTAGHSFIAGLSYTNERIAIYRSIDALTQTNEYTNQGAFLSQTIEDSFDQIYYVLQEHSEILQRTLQIDPFDTVVDGYATEEEQRQAVTLPSLDGVDGGIIYFDSTLQQFVLSDNSAITDLNTVASVSGSVVTVAADLDGADTIGTVAADLAGADTIGAAASLISAGSPGLISVASAGTANVRSITAPNDGLSVTNGDGASGNPAIVPADDLAAVEALSGTGLAVRTGADSWAQRSLASAGNGLSITNGDGVSGNPTFTLSQDLQASGSPTFAGLTLTGNIDAQGNQLILDADNDTYIVASTDDRLQIVVGGSEVIRLDANATDTFQLDGVGFSPTGAVVGQALGYPNSTTTLEPYTPAGAGDLLAAADETVTGRWGFDGGLDIQGKYEIVEAQGAGVDSLAAIHAARDRVGAGGVIMLAPGQTYEISSRVELDDSHTLIIPEGTTLELQSGANSGVAFASNDCTLILNGTIDCGGYAPGVGGVARTGCRIFGKGEIVDPTTRGIQFVNPSNGTDWTIIKGPKVRFTSTGTAAIGQTILPLVVDIQQTSGDLQKVLVEDCEVDATAFTKRQLAEILYQAPQTVTTAVASTDVLTIPDHGFSTELGVQANNGVVGLSTGTDYFVRVIDGDTFTLHPTAADATANTNTINITSDITASSPTLTLSVDPGAPNMLLYKVSASGIVNDFIYRNNRGEYPVAEIADEWFPSYYDSQTDDPGGRRRPTVFELRASQQEIFVSSVSGTFQAGETITGGTSGSTRVVGSVGSESLRIATGSGRAEVFEAGETITGGTSGATATVDRIVAGVRNAVISNNTAIGGDLLHSFLNSEDIQHTDNTLLDTTSYCIESASGRTISCFGDVLEGRYAGKVASFTNMDEVRFLGKISGPTNDDAFDPNVTAIGTTGTKLLDASGSVFEGYWPSQGIVRLDGGAGLTALLRGCTFRVPEGVASVDAIDVYNGPVTLLDISGSTFDVSGAPVRLASGETLTTLVAIGASTPRAGGLSNVIDGTLTTRISAGCSGITGLETSEIVSGGTGVTVTDGEISIGQAVGTSDAPTFADLTIQGSTPQVNFIASGSTRNRLFFYQQSDQVNPIAFFSTDPTPQQLQIGTNKAGYELVFYSGAGSVVGEFKSTGQLNLDHHLEIDDVQVVGNRVIDANLADTAALTAETITDNTGGSASQTLAAIDNALSGVNGLGDNAAPLAGVNTELGNIRDALASLADEVNKLRADNAAQKTALDAALTLIRTHGLGATS